MNKHFIAFAVTSLLLGAVGCSHDETADDEHHARATTSGDEHHERRRADPEHDHDHDGDADRTVADSDLPTATDQSESPEDLEITRQIRAAVIADSSLSFGARNCTIITREAHVTLRGDVGSNAERDAIDRHAHEVAGVSGVDNMLVVSE